MAKRGSGPGKPAVARFGNHVFLRGKRAASWPPFGPVCPWSVRGAAPAGSFCRVQHVFVAVIGIGARPLASTVSRPAETRPDRRIAAAECYAADGKAPARSPDTARAFKGGVQVGGHLKTGLRKGATWIRNLPDLCNKAGGIFFAGFQACCFSALR